MFGGPETDFSRWPEYYAEGPDAGFNPFAAQCLFSFGWVPNNETLLKNVFLQEWAMPEPTPGAWEPKDYAKLLRGIIRRKQPGKFILLLSGGLDSRILLALLLEKYAPGDFLCLTWGVRGCRDIALAAEVAAKCGARHLVIELDGSHLRSTASTYVKATRGESFIHTEAFVLDRPELEGVETVVDGHGGGLFRPRCNHDCGSWRIIAKNPGGLFERDYAAAWNQQARDLLANDSQYINRCFWLQSFMRRFVLPRQRVVESLGYKVWAPYMDKRVIAAHFGCGYDKRDKQWNSKILALLRPELCKIPDQKEGRAFLGNRRPDPTLQNSYNGWAEWLRKVKDWAMAIYVRDDAYEAFGIRRGEMKKRAEAFYAKKPGYCFDRPLIYGLNLPLFCDMT